MTKMYLSTLKRKWLLAAVFALATGAMASSASARDGEMAHHTGHHQLSQARLQAQASAVVTQDLVRITLAVRISFVLGTLCSLRLDLVVLLIFSTPLYLINYTH